MSEPTIAEPEDLRSLGPRDKTSLAWGQELGPEPWGSSFVSRSAEWRESFAPGLVAGGCLWGHAVGHSSIGKSSTPRGSCGASNVFRHFQHKSKNWWVSVGRALKLKGKSPEAVEREEEAFYCLAEGFFSFLPLAGVFIESRCSMNAPVKYHMRTLRGISQLHVYRGGSLVLPSSGGHPSSSTYSRFPLLSIPTPSLRAEHCTTILMTSSRRLSLMSPQTWAPPTSIQSFVSYTFKKNPSQIDQSMCPFLKADLYYCFYSSLFSAGNWGLASSKPPHWHHRAGRWHLTTWLWLFINSSWCKYTHRNLLDSLRHIRVWSVFTDWTGRCSPFYKQGLVIYPGLASSSWGHSELGLLECDNVPGP